MNQHRFTWEKVQGERWAWTTTTSLALAAKAQTHTHILANVGVQSICLNDEALSHETIKAILPSTLPVGVKPVLRSSVCSPLLSFSCSSNDPSEPTFSYRSQPSFARSPPHSPVRPTARPTEVVITKCSIWPSKDLGRWNADGLVGGAGWGGGVDGGFSDILVWWN